MAGVSKGQAEVVVGSLQAVVVGKVADSNIREWIYGLNWPAARRVVPALACNMVMQGWIVLEEEEGLQPLSCG